MFSTTRAAAAAIAGLWLSGSFGSFAHAQSGVSSAVGVRKERVVTTQARGTFDVKLTPQADGGNAEDAAVGRLLIDKQFRGDLDGVSKGQMLTGGTAVKNSAGYVAIERVSGTLNGRRGTFILQHSATMNRGEPQLSITVVPDSGTGQLQGLSGKMNIIIAADGKHSYEFDYSLPAAP